MPPASTASSARNAASAASAQLPQAQRVSRSSAPSNNSAHPTAAQHHPKSEAERARELQRERERAAAKEAQRELWERTRGAGSSVLALYDDEFRSRSIDSWDADDVLPSLEEVQTKKYDPVEVPSADLLLTRGISEYTMLPKVLGRGKFSTVFLAAKNGQKYAIKHTALFPHHPLISTRLLREPTLLAELPPHPNLVTVNETIRTPGHFYLVEEYLGGYVTLEALIPLLNKQPPDQPARLPDDAAEKIFQQLISVVNSIHTPLQICHRDIKPENILVHPISLQLKLLDFGLATHFSRSEPKLSTCCGSPAFHCPEIVKALASPPGSVMYWGPEVDAWTCGITMLRCLTGVLYPLGAQHTSLRSMAIRAQRSVGMVTNPGLRDKIAKLVDMDSVKRMRYFQEMNAEQERLLGEPERERKEFKSTTYIPSEPSHTMRLPLLIGAAAEQAEAQVPPRQRSPAPSSRNTPNTSRAPSPSPLRHTHGVREAQGTKLMVLLNPTAQPPQRVLSFIKYCLRCAGILYHTWQDTSSAASAPALSASMLPLNSANASVPEGSCPPSPAPGINTPGWASLSAERLEFPGGSANGHISGLNISSSGATAAAAANVHIFQCVLHLPEPVEEPEQQLSLVQTIMAAFGRRSTPAGNSKRSLSQPPKPKTTDATAAAAEASGRAAAEAAAAAASGNGAKSSVRCLPFWMVVRFVHSSSSSNSKNGVMGSPPSGSGTAKLGNSGGGSGAHGHSHRSSSTVGRRSRAGSAAANGVVAEHHTGGAPLSKTTSRSSEHSPEASHDAHAQPHGLTSIRSSTDLPSLREGTAATTTNASSAASSMRSPRLANHEDGVGGGLGSNRPSGERQRSSSYSRAHSRQRLRSRVSQVSKPRIILYVSDERAVPALRKALSVGGTSEGSDVEEDVVTIAEVRERGGGGSIDETRGPTTPGFLERKARPSILRSQTFASAATQNGVANAITHSNTTNGLPFPSVHAGEEKGAGGAQQETTRGRAGAPPHARRSESHRAIRTQSQASVRPSFSSRSTLTSDELQRKLDALQSALRPVLTRSGRQHHHHAGANGRSGGAENNGLATVEQARLNLAGLLQMLQDAERAQGPVLQAALSPITFQLFSVLTPVLGLEPVRPSVSTSPSHRKPAKESRSRSPVRGTTGGGKAGESSGDASPIISSGPSERSATGQVSSAESGSESGPSGSGSGANVALTPGAAAAAAPVPGRATGSSASPPARAQVPKSASSSSVNSLDEPTPMSKMARSALELAAQYSSAREMFLAVQERLDLLTTQAESAENGASDRGEDNGAGTAPGTPIVERKPSHQARRPATKGWDGGLELDGLLGLLSVVIPRIKTRKPHNFSESLASLIPRATKALLSQKRSRKSYRPTSSKAGGDGDGGFSSSGPRLTSRQQNALSLLRSVAELTKVTNAWERKCLADEQKTDSTMVSSVATIREAPKRSSDVAVMFFATLAALLPHLPNIHLGASGLVSGLSEAHFFAKNPKYALQRPETPSTVSSPVLKSGSPSSEEAEAVWRDVAKAIEGLHESVHSIAFGASGPGLTFPHAAEDNSDLRASAMTSIGAFLCLTQMLALANAEAGSANEAGEDAAAWTPASARLGVEAPSTWMPAQAHAHLTLSLPVLLAGLRNHATVKLSMGGGSEEDSTTKGHMPIEPLEDAALVWILWCLEALEKSEPEERLLLPEVAIQLVQALSMHAAQSASIGRLISFIMVKQIIVKHVSEQTAADLLFDIVGPDCPFPNLRSAGVGMVRDVIDIKLTEHREAKIASPVTDGVLAPAFLRRLRSVLFTLPPGFETVKEASTQATQVLRLRVFLDDNSAWLSECCHTLFYLLKRDTANLTGIHEPALKSELHADFVMPLRSLITDWQSIAKVSKDEDVAEQRQALETVTVSLMVVSMGLDLVENVLEDIPTANTNNGAAP